MSTSRRQLIRNLAADLRPVGSQVAPLQAALFWLIATWLFVIAIALFIAPVRAGSLAQVATHGRFLVETVLGVAGSILLAGYVFADSVPGFSRRAFLTAGALAAGIWVLLYVVGLEYPALPPSMAGKRAECFLETLVYAMPPTLVAAWLTRRYYVLAPLRNIALLATSAGMVPAVLMQFACMYDPAHILSHHILPIPLLVAVAMVVEWVRLRLVVDRATADIKR